MLNLVSRSGIFSTFWSPETPAKFDQGTVWTVFFDPPVPHAACTSGRSAQANGDPLVKSMGLFAGVNEERIASTLRLRAERPGLL